MLHSEFSFLLHEFASAFSNEIPEFYYLFVENVRFPLEESPFLFSLFSLSTRTTIISSFWRALQALHKFSNKKDQRKVNYVVGPMCYK